MKKSYFNEFIKGIWKENPVLVLLLGTCPTLAVTTSGTNAVYMGLATTMVLIMSNLIISIISGITPGKIRIPVYITVIAAGVTIVDLLLQAYAPPVIKESLGIFIPLIVVNCIVLGRAEAFAAKNNPLLSILDGCGMGLGFTLTLTILGISREFLSSGSLFEIKIIPVWQTEFLLPVSAPGAFIIVGVLLAVKSYFKRRAAVKAGKLYVPPKGLDCHLCQVCSLTKQEK